MKTLLTPLLLILVAVLISSCTQKNEIETGVSGLKYQEFTTQKRY